MSREPRQFLIDRGAARDVISDTFIAAIVAMAVGVAGHRGLDGWDAALVLAGWLAGVSFACHYGLTVLNAMALPPEDDA